MCERKPGQGKYRKISLSAMSQNEPNQRETQETRQRSNGKPLRLLSWNIRYDWMGTPIHGQKVPRHTLHKNIDLSKETPWLTRRSKLIGGLELHVATHGIIALQEVLHGQLVDIKRGLNAESPGKWKYIGVGRDDGVTRGEYSPIFYNTEIHELISWRYFWLSEHPDRPGRGWDAASVRICTVGRFGFKTSHDPTHDFTVLVFSAPGVY